MKYKMMTAKQAIDKLFSLESKQLDFTFDDIDKNSFHIFSMENNIVTSYARIIPTKYSSYNETSIGRVLVNKDYRKKHLATKLMIRAIDFVKNDLKEEHITLSAQYYIKNNNKSNNK